MNKENKGIFKLDGKQFAYFTYRLDGKEFLVVEDDEMCTYEDNSFYPGWDIVNKAKALATNSKDRWKAEQVCQYRNQLT